MSVLTRRNRDWLLVDRMIRDWLVLAKNPRAAAESIILGEHASAQVLSVHASKAAAAATCVYPLALDGLLVYVLHVVIALTVGGTSRKDAATMDPVTSKRRGSVLRREALERLRKGEKEPSLVEGGGRPEREPSGRGKEKAGKNLQ